MVNVKMPSIGIRSADDPENRIQFFRNEIEHNVINVLRQALMGGSLAGGGSYTMLCHKLLSQSVGGVAIFLTSSGTDALEMAALVLDLQPGDEVIMPSWTFPSTANAVALRGAVPVFVDVEAATLNIDPACVQRAITPLTRAVFCVHYAGVGCEMQALQALCKDRALALVEDAAQGLGASWSGKPLGSWGDLGIFSFHATKNIGCGEGGALIVNRPDLVHRAEIAWEKGTNRLQYQRQETSFYEWCDLGSSFMPSELTAALLSTQIPKAGTVSEARRAAWTNYDQLITEAALGDALQPLQVPAAAQHNGHIFAVRVRGSRVRQAVMAYLQAQGIETRTHYQSLHSSPGGKRYGRAAGSLPVTEGAADGLFRLPVDPFITRGEQERVVGALMDALRYTDS
jgi:dTDP-4-amino-4,6-dideoxygalactose transaminase